MPHLTFATIGLYFARTLVDAKENTVVPSRVFNVQRFNMTLVEMLRGKIKEHGRTGNFNSASSLHDWPIGVLFMSELEFLWMP